MRKLNIARTSTLAALAVSVTASLLISGGVSNPAAATSGENTPLTSTLRSTKVPSEGTLPPATATNSDRREAAASRPNRGAPRVVPLMLHGEPIASRDLKVTRSVRGVAPSAYKGPFYNARYEEQRRCIVERESSGVYRVQGGGGNNYYGAYQMNDALADGATWMMMPHLKKEIGKKAAKKVTAELRATPANKWSRYWQDRAFWTVWNHGKGAKHWAGGRWHC